MTIVREYDVIVFMKTFIQVDLLLLTFSTS